MFAEESLRKGGLDEALSKLQDQVRKDPSNLRHRIFLFQLLAVLGDWNRAYTQLKVAGELDAGTLAMVQTYREALRCEIFRQAIFSGNGTPLVFGRPDRWTALLIEALRLLAKGDIEASQSLRSEAYELAPATTGIIDGQTFEWIADADSRLGPVLEAIINGKYYWVPFHVIKAVVIEEPTDLRDLVWMPVEFTWSNGGGTVGLVPSRYPGSENSESPQIRMCRMTEWIERDADVFLGLGQRMLVTNAADFPLLEIRKISLNTTEPSEAKDFSTGLASQEAKDG